MPFWDEPVRRNAFLKLLAILQVADALDGGHGGRVRIWSVRTDGQRASG